MWRHQSKQQHHLTANATCIALLVFCPDDQGADVPVEVLSLRWPSNKKEEANKMSTRTTSNQPVLKDYSCIAWVRFEAKHDVVTASMKLTTNGAASSSTSSAVVSAQLDRAVQVLPGVADCVNVVAGEHADKVAHSIVSGIDTWMSGNMPT